MINHNLTEENYYSRESNWDYMSVSQYKDFAGTYGKEACEASALAKINGEFVEEPGTPLLVGSYVDHYFEGTLDQFRMSHPALFKRDGNLKAEYLKAEEIIKRAERDELFMKYLSGEKQVIMAGEISGVPWKIKMDSYIPGVAIVDLKVMQSIKKIEYARDIGYLDFVQYWGYDIQGAVYQEVVRQNIGKRLPFYVAALSKEKEPDLEIIHVTQSFLDDAMASVLQNLDSVITAKYGEREPKRCGKCDFCRRTKVLKRPVGIADLLES